MRVEPQLSLLYKKVKKRLGAIKSRLDFIEVEELGGDDSNENERLTLVSEVSNLIKAQNYLESQMP
jgi:hypothetical protein